MYLVEKEQYISIGDAIETVVSGCMRQAQILSTWVESSGEEKKQDVPSEIVVEHGSSISWTRKHVAEEQVCTTSYPCGLFSPPPARS